MNIAKYMKKNTDDIKAAVKYLNKFTHKWCMNCAETEEKNDLVFRCDECEFCPKDSNGCCLIKDFKRKHMPDFKDFGCMGDL